MDVPARRPPLSQAFVDECRRERCALGLSAAVHEVGLHALTVAMVTRRAKMARNTFYELFGSQEEALRYACELGGRLLREAIESASPEGPPEERLRETIDALLGVAQQSPHLIELRLVHMRGRLDDRELVEAIAAVLGEEGAGSRGGAGPVFEELLAYSLLSPIAEQLRRGEARSLTALSGPLAELARIQLGDLRPAGSSRSTALRSS